MHSDHVVNRAAWDELAAVHGQDAYYDTAGLVAGASSLLDEEERALAAAVGPELTGRPALHVQCHIGFDTITFARRGALATGVDFSTVALAKARDLAERCGVDVEWVCADSCALPQSLAGRFDLAWATFGVLCWIADVDAWMRSVAATLTRGGRLVLIDERRRRGAAAGATRSPQEATTRPTGRRARRCCSTTHPATPSGRQSVRGWK